MVLIFLLSKVFQIYIHRNMTFYFIFIFKQNLFKINFSFKLNYTNEFQLNMMIKVIRICIERINSALYEWKSFEFSSGAYSKHSCMYMTYFQRFFRESSFFKSE